MFRIWFETRNHPKGFTLAELLITLAILGVIATFTIPKIITAQGNGQNLAKAKEVAGMVSGAFQQAQAVGSISSSTTFGILTQYMNYVATDTTAAMDGFTCSSTTPCLLLHNGGALNYPTDKSFGGTGTTNELYFVFDPDGSQNNIQSLAFFLFYQGQVNTAGGFHAASCNSGGCATTTAGADPSWFQW